MVTTIYQVARPASCQLIAPDRGGEVIEEFLAGVEPAVWGSDLDAP
jgi:hypothetical protein